MGAYFMGALINMGRTPSTGRSTREESVHHSGAALAVIGEIIGVTMHGTASHRT